MNSAAAKQRKEAEAKLAQLNKQMAKARKQRDQDKLKQLMVQRTNMVMEYRRKRGGNRIVRASELASPAPAGHFLREFGQSDREQIDNFNTDPAVTQSLSLMNGFIEKEIAANSNTVLMRNVFNANPEKKFESVYLTMLSRKPSRTETSSWRSEFTKNPKQAVADLIWVLANSNEFIFVK